MSDPTSSRLPLVRPPRLRGEGGEASRLELFFDLAYVLVVLQLAEDFYADLTWHGLAVLVGLFTALRFSWIGFTLYANRFDTDDVVFRLAKLDATSAIAGRAAAASNAICLMHTITHDGLVDTRQPMRMRPSSQGARPTPAAVAVGVPV